MNRASRSKEEWKRSILSHAIYELSPELRWERNSLSELFRHGRNLSFTFIQTNILSDPWWSVNFEFIRSCSLAILFFCPFHPISLYSPYVSYYFTIVSIFYIIFLNLLCTESLVLQFASLVAFLLDSLYVSPGNIRNNLVHHTLLQCIIPECWRYVIIQHHQ